MIQDTTDLSTKELQRMFARGGDSESAGELAYLLAKAHAQAGRNDQARSMLESSLGPSRAAFSPHLQNRLQLELATLTAHADHQFAAARTLLDELIDSAHIGELAGNALLERGYCLLHTSKLEKAERDIRRGLGFVRDRNQRLGVAKGLQYMGMVKTKQNDPIALEDACQHLLEAAQVAKGVPGQLSQIADSLGRAFSRRGKYDMAARWLNSSIKKKRELGDQTGIAISYGGLGEAHLRAGQFAEATQAYNESLQMVQQLEPVNFVLVGGLLCLLSECSRRQQNLAQASDMLLEANRALPHIADAQRPISEAYINTYQARIHHDESHYKDALQLLHEAESKFAAAAYESFLPAVRRGIGEAQIQLGDLAAAKRVLIWAEAHESDPYEKRFIYENLTQLAKLRDDRDGIMRNAAQMYFLNEQLAQAPAPSEPSAKAIQRSVPELREADQAKIELLSEPPTRAFVGETIKIELQVSQPSGKPLPNIELRLESESLRKQGGSFDPAEQLQTDARGKAHFAIALGKRRESVVINVRATTLPVMAEIVFQVQDVDVRSAAGSPPLSDQFTALLRQMFYKLARDIEVEQTTTRSDEVTFLRVKCNLAGRMPGRGLARCLVKIAPTSEITAERDAYNDRMEWIKEARLPAILATASLDDRGAIAYLLPGTGAGGNVQPLSQGLAKLDDREINRAIDNLFRENLACLYQEPRFVNDVLAISYPLPEDFDAEAFWMRIADRFSPDVLRRDERGRVVIRFPGNPHIPGLFALHRQFMRGEHIGQRARVQGGVTTDNLCLDEAGQPLLTDWTNFGEGHLFYDFITLEIDVRLKAMKDRKVSFSFEQWFDIESKMSEAYRLGLSGYWPRVRELTQPLATPALRKAYAVVLQTRQTASAYLDTADPAEYMRGLYCYTLDKLVSSHGQQEIFMLLSLAVTLSTAMQRIAIKFEDLLRLRSGVVAEVTEFLGIDNPGQLDPRILDPGYQSPEIKIETTKSPNTVDIPKKPTDRPETFQETQARRKAAKEAKTTIQREAAKNRGKAQRAQRDQQYKERDERIFMRALQGATRETFDKLLGNISNKQRDILYEELCDYRKPEPDRVIEAQRQVLDTIRRLDAKGINLFEPEQQLPKPEVIAKTTAQKAKKAIAKRKEKKKTGHKR